MSARPSILDVITEGYVLRKTICAVTNEGMSGFCAKRNLVPKIFHFDAVMILSWVNTGFIGGLFR